MISKNTIKLPKAIVRAKDPTPPPMIEIVENAAEEGVKKKVEEDLKDE